MPCYTINMTTVELTAARVDLFKSALSAAGWTVHRETESSIEASRGYASLRWTRGGKVQLTSDSAEADTAELKRQYSRAAVYKQAKRYGWRVQEKGNKFTVQRR